ncbi:unnamed protein product, partial [Polarella glacialis]
MELRARVSGTTAKELFDELAPLTLVLLCEPGALPTRLPRRYCFGQIVKPRGAHVVLASSSDAASDVAVPWEVYCMGSVATPLRIDAVLSQKWAPSAAIRSIILGNVAAATRSAPLRQDVLDGLDCLNPSQAGAVVAAWREAGVTLIHGPPGTGKTTTSCELLARPYHAGVPTLACAPSNGAVGELLRKFLKHIGGNGSAVNRVVLVANEERAQVKDDPSSPVSLALLSHRVRRIQNTLAVWMERLPKLEQLCHRPVTFFDGLQIQEDNPQHGQHQNQHGQQQPQQANAREHHLQQALMHQWAIISTDAQQHASLLKLSLTLGQRRAGNLCNACCALCHSLEVLQAFAKQMLEALPAAHAVIEQDLKRFRIQKRAASSGIDSEPDEMDVLMSLRSLPTEGDCAIRSLTTALMDCRPFMASDADQDENPSSDIAAELLEGATLVFCTASVSANRQMRRRIETCPFEIVLMDEACQAVEPEVLLALGEAAKQLWLVGDPKQLPATILSQLASAAGYGRPLFDRLHTLGMPSQLLNVQHRMHPEISYFVNKQFYSGRLADAPNVVATAQRAPAAAVRFRHIEWFDTALLGYTEERPPASKSWHNPSEGRKILEHLRAFYQSDLYKSVSVMLGTAPSVGIISPYSAQVELLEGLIRGAKNIPAELKRQIQVRSVDGFQGQERDVIIFSAVRANSRRSIGFLEDTRRLNVALSRAKLFLWIFGHVPTLAHSKGGEGAAAWQALYAYLAGKGRVLPADARVSAESAKDLADMNHQVSTSGPARGSAGAPALRHAGQSGASSNSQVFAPAARIASIAIDDWDVLVSKAFKENLDQRKDLARQVVMEKLQRLRQGDFPKPARVVGPPDAQSNYFNIPVQNGYIAFSVVVDEATFRQTLKIWDLVRNAQELDLLRQRVSKHLTTFSQEYLEHCSYRRGRAGVAQPLQFGKASFPVRASDTEKQFEQVVGTATPLSLEKFYGFGWQQMQQMVRGSLRDAALPLHLNAEESEAVNSENTVYLLGRAGAGKTAVVMARALHVERSWRAIRADLGPEAPRTASALVLTMSPRLCLHLSREYEKVQHAEDAENNQAVPRPDPGLMDEEAQRRALSSLPKSFEEIDSIIGRTPTLIITTSMLLRMLDSTLPQQFMTGKRAAEDSLSEITYERFVSDYWPSIRSSVNERSDSPVLVFKEIISVIKGTPRVLLQGGTEAGARLSGKQYLSGENLRDSCFLNDSKARARVYSAFEAYEKLRRRQLDDYDIVDFVRDLLGRINTYGYNGVRFESLLIDEAQDVLPCMFLLLRHVCPNVQRWTLAADTAQTIGKLGHWRFAMVRSFIWEEISCADMTLSHRTQSKPPEILTLTQNYRSVRGVLDLASSVIDALVHFFPDHVDKLPRERAFVDTAAKPIFVCGVELESAMRILSGQASHESAGTSEAIEFGAQQVLIARREKEKLQLKRRFPTSLVLTPFDAKGQEFNDVFVVEFCGSTSDDGGKASWRQLPQWLAAEGLLTGSYDVRGSTRFDPSLHAILNEHLKELYVVITRARRRLIFFESACPESEAVQAYWSSLGLVDVASSVQDLERLAQKFGRLEEDSTPADWLKQGRDLFDSGKYEDAALCFRRAKEPELALFAEATQIRQAAESQRDLERRKTLFVKAAGLYHRLSEGHSSLESEEARRLLLSKHDLIVKEAGCFMQATAYAQAAELFHQEAEHANAGDAWERARQNTKAAKSYAKAGLWDRSARCWEQEKKWPEAAEAWTRTLPPQHALAAPLFEKAQDWRQAANSYEQVPKWASAGNCWEKAGVEKK